MINPVFRGIQVCFDPDNLTIQFVNGDGHWIYEVDLERMASSANILDFIFQINAKTWATPEVVKAFLDCIEEACAYRFSSNAQGVFCAGGNECHPRWQIGKAKRVAQ